MQKICSLNTNFTSLGSGEVVLFLHGWSSDTSDFEGSAKHFSKFYHVYNLDLWGFGKSEAPKKAWGVEEYAKAIHEFVLKNKLKNINLVGHSFGGKLAVLYAFNYADYIKSLTLVDSAGMKPRFSLKKFLQVKKYKKLKQKVQQGKINESVLKKYGSQDYQNSQGVMREILTKVVNQNVEQQSKNICVPTMIVWGKHDKDTPIYMAKRFHKNINGSELHILNGGHFCHIDCFEEFNFILENFWRSL